MDKYKSNNNDDDDDDDDENKGNCLLPTQFDNNTMLLPLLLPPPPTPLSSTTSTSTTASAAAASANMDVLQSLKTKLMSNKDLLAEQFVLGFVNGGGGNGQNQFGETTTAAAAAAAATDDAHQSMVTNAIAKLTEISPILAHRFMPILKEYIGHLQQQELNLQFAHVTNENIEQQQQHGNQQQQQQFLSSMSLKYKNCFNTFIDAKECVSIKALDTKLLGKLDPKDVYILTLWAMATCKRQKGDNILQLVCSGKSSSGNNLFFIYTKCVNACK